MACSSVSSHKSEGDARVSIKHTRTVKHLGTDHPIEFIHGERYHPELSNKTIAKKVKGLIVQAIKAKLLPMMKVSVTSGRGTVTVRILEASFAFKSETFYEVKELITRFLLAFQKQECWVNGDYIDNNFCDHVEWWVDDSSSQIKNAQV